MSVILEIKNLSIQYYTGDATVYALNNVSLQLHNGEVLGLVGETGAGKTTLAKGIMQFIPPSQGEVVSGEILYNGKNLLQATDKELRDIRGQHISMIFQNPMTALNPVITVGEQIAEVIQIHENISKEKALSRAVDMLELVGIPGNRHLEYPHQFSGGMKQRVVIAIALACNPQILLADEPTTALDVTIQAQVLELMDRLRRGKNTSMILITHDLGVVAQNCDTVAVIYAGEIIEYGDVISVFEKHLHPYTTGLLMAIPSLVAEVKRLNVIEGQMPNPTQRVKGCKFYPRCKFATSICAEKEPPVVEAGNGHTVKCWQYADQQDDASGVML